jgi:hypothetical protein
MPNLNPQKIKKREKLPKQMLPATDRAPKSLFEPSLKHLSIKKKSGQPKTPHATPSTPNLA